MSPTFTVHGFRVGFVGAIVKQFGYSCIDWLDRELRVVDLSGKRVPGCSE